MKPTCLRCGYCCREMLGIVPKNEESNLSPEFMDKLVDEFGFYAGLKYVEENSLEIGKRCKWLKQDSYIKDSDTCPNTMSECMAYKKRGECCISYMKNTWCNVGLITWAKHAKRGYEIPEDILKVLKNHPMYHLYFGEEE